VHNPHGSFTKWTLPQPAPEIPWASAEGACAEVLNIVRPCAYAVARYFCADESWKPFLLSLTFDVSSRIFVGELSRLSRAQQEEVARRMMMWSFYFLRSPLFDKFTKYAEAHFFTFRYVHALTLDVSLLRAHLRTPLSWVLGLLGRIPLIGVVFGTILATLEDSHSWIRTFVLRIAYLPPRRPKKYAF
jgi:hypothetical protein